MYPADNADNVPRLTEKSRMSTGYQEWVPGLGRGLRPAERWVLERQLPALRQTLTGLRESIARYWGQAFAAAAGNPGSARHAVRDLLGFRKQSQKEATRTAWAA